MTATIQSFTRLSDDELLATVKRLALTERRATAAVVRSLIELDVRRLYLGEGYSSLFTYCTQALHLAEGAAYNRIEAARAARRFPAVLTALEDGSVTLTAVRLLAPHLTEDNHQHVLASACHKGKREIEQPVPQSVRLDGNVVVRTGSPAGSPPIVRRVRARRISRRCVADRHADNRANLGGLR